MSGLTLALALLCFAWLADLVAERWGFTGRARPQLLARRSTSSRLKGQASSALPRRRTGMRSP